MPNISPGVYTKIVDLSTFVQAVPGSIGLVCALTEKGPDNVLTFLGSRASLVSQFGEPDITKYGKRYGQGPYCAYNFLGESGALYFMRCLPDDSQFSNLRIDCVMAAGDATASIQLTYVDSVNSKDEIKTSLATLGTTYPIGMLYPVGRGEYYNGIGVRFTEHTNPLLNGVYVLDVYEKQSDGDDVIIESFEVSFDPLATDNAGDSIFLGQILELYSSVLRFDMELASGAYTGGYDLVSKLFDKDVGTVSVVGTPGSSNLTDIKQDFEDWENSTETGNATYCVLVKDGKGNSIRGWLGASGGDDGDTVNVFNARNLDTATQSWELYNETTGIWNDWNGTSTFDANSEMTYEIKKSFANVAAAFISAEPAPLKKGSDGSLLTASGDLDSAEATTLLASGYAGTLTSPDDVTTLVDDILDTENIYFNLVFDCGYPTSVKTQISSLVQTRRDCVAIMDNGDNASFTAANTSRLDSHTYNTYYVALYEEYNKVYDVFTGQDTWFSPIYHMSYILPRNDAVSEIWFAAAGFNRAAIDSIKELRFNPRIGQRDQMYLKQLNPIVKFNEGYVVWGQLTSQAKASAMQDLNIVRLVLYCKRALERYCRSFIFEQNDAITWNSVSGDITDFLESIKKKRGLYSYSIAVGATEYELKSKTFHVDVTLNPTRVAEKIELNFFIK